MARVTIEDCLDHVENMYELVHVATLRARQLFIGSGRTVQCKNKEVVTSLREIAAGHVAVHRADSDDKKDTLM